MIRSVPLVIAMLMLVGCDRSDRRSVDSTATANGAFDNAAASRSIMQPAVVAASEPEPAPSPTPPPQPTGATVQFARGAQLDVVARETIDRLLATPGLSADARYIVRGSSDTGGSDAANLATSRRRAEAVRDYLITKGIDTDRIEVIALGDGRAVAPNVNLDGSDDPAGRARNRRADIVIVPPTSATPAIAPSPTATAGTQS